MSVPQQASAPPGLDEQPPPPQEPQLSTQLQHIGEMRERGEDGGIS